MNTIAAIILLFIILDLVLHLVSDTLNLNMLRNDLPDAFQGIFDPESYKKSQDYLKVNTRFGWISTVFNTIVMLLFWFAGGFAMLDNWARSLGQGPVVTGLIYIGVLMLAYGTVEELLAVLAHEMGHYKKKHIFQGMLYSLLLCLPELLPPTGA